MDSKAINQANNWSYWSEAYKNELKNAHLNPNVGDKVVFENDEFRIWTIHLHPGDRIPFHIHRQDYYWTALSEGTARSHFDDGSVVEGHYDIGDTKYFKHLNEENYFIHDLHNIGDSVLIFSTVEFKN
ncbi:MAG: cupin domain-containing protein [Chloroflexota bacterium]